MKHTLLFSLFFALTAAIVPAHAQTYQWKDSSGRTIISDTPPPGTTKSAKTLGGPAQKPTLGSESAAAPADTKAEAKPAEAPKTMAEKELDFKKRQLEAKEKAEKEAKEQKLAADRKENCERARRNLAAMEANHPVATFNEKGERQILEGAQREQELARTRQIVAESCK